MRVWPGLTVPSMSSVLLPSWAWPGVSLSVIGKPLASPPRSFFAARRFGPTRLSAAGAALGAVAGALAAIPYSLFCPIDSAPYVATGYTAAIVLCAGIGALAGGRMLVW